MARYTELTDEQLRRALAMFGLTCPIPSHLAGGASNTSYLANCSDGTRVVLTVVDNAIDLPPEIHARLLRYLEDHGVATSEPVPDLSGALVADFDGHRLMVKRVVDGACHRVLPFEHLEAAGNALGRLHTLAPPGWLPRRTRRLAEVHNVMKVFEDREFVAWVLGRLEESQSLLAMPGPVGIVHGDYFADNLIVRPDGAVAILDWETASIDLVILDLGFALVDLARISNKFELDRKHELLAGYEAVRPLTEDERAHLRASVVYAATVLGYHRYLRHHIRYPDPSLQDVYLEMPAFVETLGSDWP